MYEGKDYFAGVVHLEKRHQKLHPDMPLSLSLFSCNTFSFSDTQLLCFICFIANNKMFPDSPLIIASCVASATRSVISGETESVFLQKFLQKCYAVKQPVKEDLTVMM